MTTNFQCAADAFAAWRADVLGGRPPVLYPAGVGDLARLEIGPGLVTLLGGAPGAGKTALTMQLLIDALRLTPTLRAVVCNVEMAAGPCSTGSSPASPASTCPRSGTAGSAPSMPNALSRA